MKKWFIRYKWLIISTLICIALSLYFHETETIRRGYRSFGGEFTIAFYPVIFYGLNKTNKDMKEVINNGQTRSRTKADRNRD